MNKQIFKELNQIKIIQNNKCLTEPFLQKENNLFINKWLCLQKIVKENQILEKIIEKQHSDNNEQMKKYILDKPFFLYPI